MFCSMTSVSSLISAKLSVLTTLEINKVYRYRVNETNLKTSLKEYMKSLSYKCIIPNKIIFLTFEKNFLPTFLYLPERDAMDAMFKWRPTESIKKNHKLIIVIPRRFVKTFVILSIPMLFSIHYLLLNAYS